MSSLFRVLLTDIAWTDDSVERAILEQGGAELILSPDKTPSTLARYAHDVDAIGVTWAPVTRDVIRAAIRCKIIARFGIGLDNIDVAEATRQHICVTNVPDYCLSEVSDHTLALILAATRNVAQFHLRTKSGLYNLSQTPPIRRLSTLTLGLVGLGRIGREVARKAATLGMQVQATTRSGTSSDLGIPMRSLPDLLRTSDIVSLHLPLTAASRKLINRETLAWMRPNAWLINTSRGGLVDQDALWEALQQNRLAGAALDVFDPEPPDLTQELFRDPRVIVTPHAAFVSQESLIELRTRAAKQIVAVLHGEQPENIVNASR